MRLGLRFLGPGFLSSCSRMDHQGTALNFASEMQVPTARPKVPFARVTFHMALEVLGVLG